MAITFFGVAATPSTDDGTNTSDPTAVTPPSSMIVGQLITLWAVKRNAASAITMSATGGQSWTSTGVHNSSTATLSANMFWCIFNGTWSANPSVTFNATTCNTVVMLVFSPSPGSEFVGVDPQTSGSPSLSSYPTPSSPFTVSFADATAVNASNVDIAFWSSDDNNTWGTLSGTGWSQSGLAAQYRNSSGSDSSCAFAYKISAASADIFLNQATLGGDPGIIGRWYFYELKRGKTLNINQSINRSNSI